MCWSLFTFLICGFQFFSKIYFKFWLFHGLWCHKHHMIIELTLTNPGWEGLSYRLLRNHGPSCNSPLHLPLAWVANHLLWKQWKVTLFDAQTRVLFRDSAAYSPVPFNAKVAIATIQYTQYTQYNHQPIFNLFWLGLVF